MGAALLPPRFSVWWRGTTSKMPPCARRSDRCGCTRSSGSGATRRETERRVRPSFPRRRVMRSATAAQRGKGVGTCGAPLSWSGKSASLSASGECAAFAPSRLELGTAGATIQHRRCTVRASGYARVPSRRPRSSLSARSRLTAPPFQSTPRGTQAPAPARRRRRKQARFRRRPLSSA